MSEARTCKKCGASIPKNAPFGRCPHCLLALALKPTHSKELSPSDAPRPQGAELAQNDKPPDPATATGRAFGDYELLEQIGRGGMGVVFKALQISLRRYVALKLALGGEFASPATQQRFRVEAEAAAKLDHPNIVPIYEIGVHQGQHFLSMKLIEGGTLSEQLESIRRGRAASRSEISTDRGASEVTQVHLYDTRDAARLIATVARAVHFAHQRGVLHRDLKPGNILLDDHGEPHITDFGLAKILEHELGVTRTAEVLGTPSYMSPEQAAGLQLSTAADLWSLGVILYELLTGRLPFLAESTPALLRAIAESEPLSLRRARKEVTQGAASLERQTPASDLHRSETGSWIDADLETVCLKCLEKDPARRYPSAQALAEDLERWLRHETVLARAATPAERMTKWIRRQPLLAALLALLCVVLVVGVGGVISQWRRAEHHAAEESRQRKRAEEGLRRAEGAEQKMKESLRDAYLAQATAMRSSAEMGRRFQGLEVLAKAAAIQPSAELRDEAIACMAVTDLTPLEARNFEAGSDRAIPDDQGVNYALIESSGSFRIRRVSGDGELARVPAVGSEAVAPWRFSPDGRLLALSYGKNHLRVWDWAKSKVVLDVPEMGAAGFSPDSTRLATADATTLSIYDLLRGTKVKAIPRVGYLPEGQLGLDRVQLSFQPGGPLLAVQSSEDSHVTVLNLDSGKEAFKFSHPKSIAQVAWHPSGRYLAAACLDQLLYIWDTTTGEQIRTLPCNSVSVTFGRGGDLLATSGWDVGVDLWSFPSCKRLVTTAQQGNGLLYGFSSDDRRLILGDWMGGRTFQIYEIAHHRERISVRESDVAPDRAPANLVFSNDGKLLAFTTSSGVGVWDVQARRELRSFDGPLTVLGFDLTTGDLLMTGSSNLFRWSVRDSISDKPRPVVEAKLLPSATPLGGRMGWLSKNGEVCVVWGDDRCQIFRNGSFTELHRTSAELGMWYQTLSPDGSWLASGARWSPVVKVWDTRSGLLVKELKVEDLGLGTSVLFSPDGGHLITSTSQSYQFWDVHRWESDLQIEWPRNSVPARMTFSHDGRILAATVRKELVRFYDARSGKILAELEAPNPKTVSGMAFSPDDTSLAVCRARNTVDLWDLRAIRKRLAEIHLDWDMPPYPAQGQSSTGTSPEAR